MPWRVVPFGNTLPHPTRRRLVTRYHPRQLGLRTEPMAYRLPLGRILQRLPHQPGILAENPARVVTLPVNPIPDLHHRPTRADHAFRSTETDHGDRVLLDGRGGATRTTSCRPS